MELALYAPASGLVFVEGWAADVSRPQPLRSLEPGPSPGGDSWARLEYGRPRPELAPDCGSLGDAGCGFEYSAFIPPEAMAASRERGIIDLRAVTVEGATSVVELSLAKLWVLPELSGREWRGLALAVKEAAAQGAADQQAESNAR